LLSMRSRLHLRCHHDCDCRPRQLSPSESPYGFGDHHMEKLITVSIWGFNTNGSPLPYGDPDMGTGSDISPYGNG
jgi:hypothetical protein